MTVSSTQHCDLCNTDVKIGLGGHANWKQHIQSNKHVAKERGVAKVPDEFPAENVNNDHDIDDNDDDDIYISENGDIPLEHGSGLSGIPSTAIEPFQAPTALGSGESEGAYT